MIEEKEKELDIKDMLFRILEKWRWMLVWAIVMAVALAGLKYLKDKRNSHDGEDTDEVLSVMMEDMTPSERSNIETYISLYENLERHRKDMKSRLIYQIDPYHEKVLLISYAIKLPEVENGSGEYIIAQHLSDDTKINQIATMYSDYVSSSDFINEIAKAVPEISESDLRTLVSGWNTNGVVYVQIIIVDGMDVDTVAESTKNNLEAYTETLKESDKHEFNLLNESTKEIVDDNQVNIQNSLVSMEYNLQNQVNYFGSTLGETEKEYIETYIEGKTGEKLDNEDEEVNNKKSSKGISIKFAILGAIVGIFLVCMLELMRYIFSGKLHTADMISEYYELQVFGIQSVSDKKLKKKGIDKLLYNFENGKKKELTQEAQKEIISSGIKLTLEQQDIKEIVLTGTDIEKLDDDYIKDLQSEFSKAGVKTSVENNIYYYPEALKRTAEIKNIILFETIDVSTEYEIENILQKAREYDIKVLGVVAFKKV